MNPACLAFRARLARALMGPGSRSGSSAGSSAGQSAGPISSSTHSATAGSPGGHGGGPSGGPSGGSGGAESEAAGGSLAPELAWHEHVLTCGDCRALLDSEEALDGLLESLPRPSLPPELARRVLARLQGTRDDQALDRLLDRALGGALGEAQGGATGGAPGGAPGGATLARDPQDSGAAPGLAGRILAGLRPDRERLAGDRRAEIALDALLARVPPPRVPARLAARLLAGLDGQRAAPAPLRSVSSRAPGAPNERPRWAWPLLAAASVALLAGGAVWRYVLRSPVPGADGPRTDLVAPGRLPGQLPGQLPGRLLGRDAAPPPAGAPFGEPEPELLAQLELLESWELLNDDELDFELIAIDESTLLGVTASTSLELGEQSGEQDGDEAPAAPRSEKG